MKVSRRKAAYWRTFRKFRKLFQKYIDEKEKYTKDFKGQPWEPYQEIKQLMKEAGAPIRSPW